MTNSALLSTFQQRTSRVGFHLYHVRVCGAARGAAMDSGPPGQHIHSGPPAFRGWGGVWLGIPREIEIAIAFPSPSFFPLLPNQIILLQLLQLFSFVCNGKVIIFLFYFWYNIWLINARWWTFIIVYSYMVMKVFNIQPVLFDQYYLWFKFCDRNSFFLLSLSRSWCHTLQENKNCLFCLYLYTFHFLRLKQKMDSLLFLIKKHNNNKTVLYNDKLA